MERPCYNFHTKKSGKVHEDFPALSHIYLIIIGDHEAVVVQFVRDVL